jgi:hypothetical protein
MKSSKLGGYEYMWLSKLSRYNCIQQGQALPLRKGQRQAAALMRGGG